MTKTLVLLSPGFEEIEAITIIDILRRADIEVVVAGLEKNLVMGSHQVSVNCDVYYKDIDIDDFEYLVLPGGQPGTNNLMANETILKWIKHFSENNKFLGAICAAPLVLNAAKVLTDKKVTSYPTEKQAFKSSTYLEKNVVIDENIITSRGVGTAIEFSLELVKIIKGKKVRDELASKILWKL